MEIGFEPVAVGIDDEGGIIEAAVIRPDARFAVIRAARCHGCRMKRVDGGLVRRDEAEMQPRLHVGDNGMLGLYHPETDLIRPVADHPIGIGQTLIAERCQRRIVEAARSFEVFDADRNMVKHGLRTPFIPGLRQQQHLSTAKKSRIRLEVRPLATGRCVLLQVRFFQKAVAVGGFDAQPGLPAVAQDAHRNLGTGRAAAPELAVEIGQAVDLFVTDLRDDIALTQAGLGGWTAFGDAHHHHAAIALGGECAEPGPRRLVDLAAVQEIVEDRRQQIDRHDHIDVRDLAVLAHLQAKRTDTEQFAVGADQRCPAPCRMSGCGKDRFIQQIFPVAGEFLSGDDVCLNELADSIGKDDRIAGPGGGRVTEIHGRSVENAERLHQAEAAFLIIGKGMGGNHPAVLGRQPDFLRLGDEITDGQHQAVVANDDAAALPDSAKRLRREGIFRNGGTDGHD
ncbi:hypothetical protein RHECNPAF_1340044 [Rhizobium etli CNPAF512]|nr:hypothetical protein RHECNPAF_1340044 [Rhizobium etli CNPAF512]